MSGDRNGNRIVTLLMAAAVGGGGTSAALPLVAPTWYRPDPATGSELRDVRRDLDELRGEFHEFLRDGPRRVTENQTRMEGKLDRLVSGLDRCLNPRGIKR
jgi:hypothetical protein